MPSKDPVDEGARARAHGRPKDACPYPADTPERTAWLEGYDGAPADRAPDLPMDRGRRARPAVAGGAGAAIP